MQILSNDLLYLKGDGTDIVIGAAGQKLGLGVTPTRQLHVNGTGQATAALTDAGAAGGTLYLQDAGGGGGNGGAILFGSTFGNWAAIKALVVDGSGTTTGDLAFSTRNTTADTALTERMRLMAGGNLGIGTANPQGKLHALGAGGSGAFLQADAVGGTAVTLAVAGTVTYAAGALFMIRDSAGTVTLGNATATVPGGFFAMIADGTNTYQFQVSAGGAIAVQRTLGARTFKVAMWALWV